MTAAQQPLDSPVYAAQPVDQPVKPVAGRCDELGHFYDRDGDCIYGCHEEDE